MGFSSVQDPPNWHYHHLQQPNLHQETIISGNAKRQQPSYSMSERAKIPQPETALKCPRCESTNTKFCYFNNYNLSQPRHFCKTCRRYWTRGGVLRNVPVGGGCRRNKKSTSSSKPHLGTAARGNGTGTHGKHAIISSSTCSSIIAPQLPLLSPLQNLGQFGGLNLRGIQAQMGSVSTHDSILSADQWSSGSMHNFPFLAGGFDQSIPRVAINSNLMFTFQNEGDANEAATRSGVSGAVKMEESQLGLRSSATPFSGISGNSNQYCPNSWGGGHGNVWIGAAADPSPAQQLNSSAAATTTYFL